MCEGGPDVNCLNKERPASNEENYWKEQSLLVTKYSGAIMLHLSTQ